MTETAHDSAEGATTQGREKLLQALQEGMRVVQDGGWPAWSPFVETHEPGSPFCVNVGCDHSFANSRYQVLVNFEQAADWPPLAHVRIKAHDKRCVRDWRDMQRIKNEICGTEAEGVELYPAEGRLVDEVNEFHVYVLHPAADFPFGRPTRATATPEDARKDLQGNDIEGGPWQREFEHHHDARDCLPRGRIAWPDWSLGKPDG